MQNKSIAKVFDAILCVPGMNKKMKVGMSISRKNILLLCRVIERGTSRSEPDEKSADIIDIIGDEGVRELNDLVKELLVKAELTEVNEMIKSF